MSIKDNEHNLVFITVECLRYNTISSLIKNNSLPNFIRLLKKGVFFKQAISTSPWTAPSAISFLTSTYPLMYDGYLNFSPRKSFVKLLRKAGFSTIYCETNPWISKFFGFDKGFSSFIDGSRIIKKTKRQTREHVIKLRQIKRFLGRKKNTRISSIITFLRVFSSKYLDIPLPLQQVSSISAEQLTDAYLRLIKKCRPPIFAWVHYMDSHDPHNPYEPSLCMLYKFVQIENKIRENRRLSKNEISWIFNWYKDSILHVDKYVGILLSKLEEWGITLDNTYLILTSDHGQEFFEHGIFGHNLHLYDELIHVPLFIAGPDLSSSAVPQQISLIDLPPTILGLLGINEAPRNYLGRDLSNHLKESKPRLPNNPAISEEGIKNRESLMTYEKSRILKLDLGYRRISYRFDGWKYIYNENSADELYNLVKDPGEHDNIIEEESGLAKESFEKIRQHMKMEEKTKSRQREHLRILNLSKELRSTI